jgi:hypothetical protein
MHVDLSRKRQCDERFVSIAGLILCQVYLTRTFLAEKTGKTSST